MSNRKVLIYKTSSRERSGLRWNCQCISNWKLQEQTRGVETEEGEDSPGKIPQKGDSQERC